LSGSDDKNFYLLNGMVLSSLKDLEDEIKRNIGGSNVENFEHHVLSGRNDYASWVRHVFHKKELANKLDKCFSPVDFLKVLSKNTANKGVVKKVVKKSVKKSEKKVEKRVVKSVKKTVKKPVNKVDDISDSRKVLENVKKLVHKRKNNKFVKKKKVVQGHSQVVLLNEKIEACKELATLGLMKESMLLYNELRKQFVKMKLAPSENEAFRKDIKDLYFFIKERS